MKVKYQNLYEYNRNEDIHLSLLCVLGNLQQRRTSIVKSSDDGTLHLKLLDLLYIVFCAETNNLKN